MLNILQKHLHSLARNVKIKYAKMNMEFLSLNCII